MRRLREIREVFDYMSGVSDHPPPEWQLANVWWGVWWAVLLLSVLVFSGQTSRFIYIDF